MNCYRKLILHRSRTQASSAGITRREKKRNSIKHAQHMHNIHAVRQEIKEASIIRGWKRSQI